MDDADPDDTMCESGDLALSRHSGLCIYCACTSFCVPCSSELSGHPSLVQENYLLGRLDLCADLCCSELWGVESCCRCLVRLRGEPTVTRCCSDLITGGLQNDTTAVLQSVPYGRVSYSTLASTKKPSGSRRESILPIPPDRFESKSVPCATRRHKLLWCWSASSTSLHSPSGSFCSNSRVPRNSRNSSVSLLPAPCIVGPHKPTTAY